MTAAVVSAARRIQRHTIHPSTYAACPKCKRTLSIAEVIERHCISCELDIQPEELGRATAA